MSGVSDDVLAKVRSLDLVGFVATPAKTLPEIERNSIAKSGLVKSGLNKAGVRKLGLSKQGYARLN